jgi:hypothetical protein
MTTFLAIWGAILSTLTLGWTLYRDLLDRPRINVTARLRIIGRRSGDGAFFAADPKMNIEGASDDLVIVVSVINIGRRKFSWRGIGGKYIHPVGGRGNFIVSAQHLPKILEEQEAHDEIVLLNEELAYRNLKELYVNDGTGRHWRVSKKDREKLLEDIKKHLDLAHLQKNVEAQ